MSKVLACIDGSVYGASVCDHAAWIATRLDAPVELLHVLHRAPEPGAQDMSGAIGLGAAENLLLDLSRLDEERGRLRMEQGRVILAEAEKRLHAAGIAEVTTRLRHGALVDNVQDLEEDCRLVVIGKRGEHADFASLHLGSSVEKVARASTLPVLVASRAFKPIEKLAIAFDGGASSRKALEFILANPQFSGFACHVVIAGPSDAKHAKHVEWVRGRLAEWGGTHVIESREGAADAVLSAYVKEANIDLLVMGAYGHSPIRQFIVGSTTTEMMRACQIPVLLFR